MRYNKFYNYIKDYNKNYNHKLPYIYVSNTVVPCRLCDPGLIANVYGSSGGVLEKKNSFLWFRFMGGGRIEIPTYPSFRASPSSMGRGGGGAPSPPLASTPHAMQSNW